ncbi:MAG: GNAT family N-acetyltransferase [Actinomycetes bacterium]
MNSFQIVRRNDPLAVERLLRALPDWFGIESSLLEYVADARTKLSYLAVEGESDAVVGVLLGTKHNRESAEVHLMAVAPGRHRQGIGRSLVEAFEADLLGQQFRILQVKTLGPSRPDENYRQTTDFYLAMGFIPLEEFPELWPENPCLILVKPL